MPTSTARWTRFRIVLLCAVICYTLTAQIATSESLATHSTNFEHFGLERGFGDSSVFAIAQDSTGFMWFGTFDGLNRYDGHQMITFRYDPSKSTSLVDSDISSMLVHSSGELWIGTWGGGIYRFDMNSEQFVHHPSIFDDLATLRDGRVQCIFEDSSGDVWVGTFAGGLSKFSAQGEVSQHFLHDSGDPSSLGNDRVWTIAEDQQGVLWIGTDNGLQRLKLGQRTFDHFEHDPDDPLSLPNHVVRALLCDRENNLWVGTQKGLCRFDPKERSCKRLEGAGRTAMALQNDPINKIIQDDRGRIWVGTFGEGLISINPDDNSLAQFVYDPTRPESISHDDVRALSIDASRMLWIGTRGGGICKLDLKTQKFRHEGAFLRGPGRLSNKVVSCLLKDADGVLWVGTRRGLNRRAPGQDGFERILHDSNDPESLPAESVQSLLEDKDGRLWVGTWNGGLAIYDHETREFTNYRHDPENPSSLSSDRIPALLEDNAGDLWVGTDRGLNRMISPTEGFVRFPTLGDGKPGLSGEFVRCLFEDSQYKLWVGTDAGGLNRYDHQQKTFVAFTTNAADPSSISHNRVFAIQEDNKNRLWVGTANGLNLFDREAQTFSHTFAHVGLHSSAILAILCDDSGMLWLSTNNGLARFDPETGNYRDYRGDDGLRGHAFSSACFKTRDGWMYFGGSHGFNYFHPELVHDNIFAPPVVLTAIKRFHEAVDFGKPLTQVNEVVFPYSDSFLTFEFAALEYTNPGQNLFAYTLEGFDRDWVEVGNLNFASYSNLDPGTYRFRVKAANSDNVWSESPLAINVEITGPFWQTWWFRSILAIFLLAVVAVVISVRTRSLSWRTRLLEDLVRERTQELEAANEAKNAFLANMSHEIRTPLNAIVGMTTLALKTDLNIHQQSYLDQIGASSRLLVDIIKDVLDLSRIEAGRIEFENADFELEQVLSRVASVAGVRADEKDLKILFDTSHLVPRFLHGDPVRLEQVLLNLTFNAVKFSPAGEITLSIELASESDTTSIVRFAVADTGIGIAEDRLPELFLPFTQADSSLSRQYGGVGLGLAISRRIVEAMGGEIWAESELDKGSTFIFTAPFARANARSADRAITHHLNGMRILVVDANPKSSKSIVEMLQQFSCEVTAAASGETALTKIAAASHRGLPYRLVIADAKMPNMGGIEMASSMHSTLEEKTKPAVILIIGSGGEKLRIDGPPAGVQALIAKPVKQSALLDSIHDALGLGPESMILYGKGQAGTRFIKGLRVLVVEDNAINLRLTKELLMYLGLEVSTASNGEQAFRLISKASYDAVLMDIQMPVMDGIQATRLIRRNLDRSELPIIALTAHAMVGDREKFLKAGMNDYVAKPIEERDLIEVLRRWLPTTTQDAAADIPQQRATDGEHRLPKSLTGIDVDEGLNRAGGKISMYKELLIGFARRNSDVAQDLTLLLENNNIDDAKVLTHKLKGTAGSIAAKNVYKGSILLETALIDGADWRSGLETLDAAMTEYISTVESLQLDPSTKPVEGIADAAKTSALVLSLERLLADNNLKARQKFDELRSVVVETDLMYDFDCMSQHLADLDFEAAKAKLNNIKAKLPQ